MDTESASKPTDTKRRALGRGLESLLPRRTPPPEPAAEAAAPPEPAAPPTGQPLEIELALLERNPYQTRTHYDAAKLTELAQSIAIHGVMQPVTVRALPDGRYQMISGERRWLASAEAGKTHIPAIVREVSNVQALEMTIVENMQRADLNPMEQARAYHRLGSEFNLAPHEMAVHTGAPRTTVSNYLRLMKLPETVQQQVESGELSFGHAKLLAALEPQQVTLVARRVTAGAFSVRQTEELIQSILHPDTSQKQRKLIEPLDPNVRELRDELQRALGLRVHIEDRDGKGKVIIEYTKLDDFDIIMRSFHPEV
jgi:ParB family chromosome partitioning protein